MARKYSRRRGLKRRIRAPVRNTRRAIRGAMRDGTFTQTTLRGVFAVTSTGSGNIESYFDNDASGLADFSNYAALYDSYKVKAVKIKFFPKLPNEVTATTLYAPMYYVMDWNTGTNPLTSNADALGYNNVRAVNMYKPWSLYMKFKKQSAVSTAVNVFNGWLPFTFTTATQGLYGYGSGFTSSITYGHIVVTKYLQFMNRK